MLAFDKERARSLIKVSRRLQKNLLSDSPTLGGLTQLVGNRGKQRYY